MKRISFAILIIQIFVFDTYAGLSLNTTPVLPNGELHPSLYFTAEEIPNLRGRVDTVPYSDWWTEVDSKSNSYIGQDLSSPNLSEEDRSKGAKACAFYYIITGDDQYADKAKEALLAMWSNPGSDSRRMLEASYHLQSYCEAYDWIQPTLDLSDDLLVRGKLASEAERFYNDPVMWSPFGYANNWGVKAASALGTVALTISDYASAAHSPAQWLSRALNRINSLLAVLTTADGLWVEGSHYLVYTCGNLIPFLWHYKNVSDVDLFDDLHPLFDFVIKVRYPDGRLPNLEDAYSNIFPHSMVAPAYREGDASAHMWAFEGSPGFDQVWWTQDVKEADLIIIHDGSIPAFPPADGPTVFLTEGRVAVLRSSWDDDGLYLYLNGAPDYYNLLAGGVHTHPDPLEFILYAHKILLANDAGYGPEGFGDDNRSWYTSPEAHNIVLVNGTAPQNAPIIMKNWIGSEHLAFVEMVASYGGATVSRSAALIGDEYAIVADYINADAEKSYDFILHARGEMTWEDRRVLWSVTNEDSVEIDLLSYLFPSTTTIELHSGLASFAWGQEETDQYLISHTEGREAHYLTILFPKLAFDPPPAVHELPGGGHIGVRIDNDLIITQGDTLLLSSEGLESDARFTLLRGTDGLGETWLIEDGTILRWEAALLVRSTARISLAAGPPTEYQLSLVIAPNGLRYDLYLALADSLWATAATIDGTDLPCRRQADGVSLQINGGGSLIIDLGSALRGDVVPDGVVNVLDLVRTVNLILGTGPEPTRHEQWAADTNTDGEIDLVDLFDIVFIILSVP
ncbi:MAG: DUF4962 domain-containing protein [bacterium]